ncbi:undecaprenyl pyrophosphate synthetase, putative [Ixodes scapularis]|uniref:ditrans,polycis-polyprenyl diphosphate synthase [(2E,6E)-farnesyldiphosphate specific] n=1 Tax=Ixodes scapularis TaxID=6945 RepID=B7P8Z0_IXOSC|nr:undecaprenyl pyrophosphate synthetase, putative [Ixodes scapularis]|eukprot:XP_002403312.1 undecaprenyl pyrophosphate synthetase, putative [Ixodes scapularis]
MVATSGCGAPNGVGHRRPLAEDVPLAWYQRLVLWIASLGPVPGVLGFIPDGNRRFARKLGLRVEQGHRAGSDKLGSVRTWATKLGVSQTSVYVFSTHNFKRPENELNGIFSETVTFCREIIDDPARQKRRGFRIRFVGDLEMLPRDLQRTVAKADIATSGNSGDITPQLIDEYMNIEDAPETEMLTRTSGEARLSDFILWQSDFAMLYFEPKNMPEVGLFDYVKAIIHYQILCQFDRVATTNGSEDCLRLNIWTPDSQCLRQGPSCGNRTVVVFIHGGDFLYGSNAGYDGTLMSSRGDLVVAVPNYRLGILGFVNGRSPENPGNLGLYDQLSALRWLRANVGYFGGDAKRMVLVGHDSGATSIGYLLLSRRKELVDISRFVFLSGNPFTRRVAQER